MSVRTGGVLRREGAVTPEAHAGGNWQSRLFAGAGAGVSDETAGRSCPLFIVTVHTVRVQGRTAE